MSAEQHLYTCESINLRVFSENTYVASVFGEHDEHMANRDVVVLRNIFSKTRYLPNGIANFYPNLIHFQVPSSRVEFVNRKNFAGFISLRNLDLRFNEIEILPNDVFIDLFNLESLLLSGNFLKKIHHNAFISNSNLRFIDLGENDLSTLDDEIFSSNYDLVEILMNNNRIKSIKANFVRFRDIGFIDLRGNICYDDFFLKDDPDHPLLFEFQEEINYNCTRRINRDIKLLPGTDNLDYIAAHEKCSEIKFPVMGKMCKKDKNN